MLNLVVADLTSHVTAHDLNLPITNHMLMVAVVAVLVWWLFSHYFKHANSDAPTGVRNFLESIIEFLRVEVFRPALKEHTDRFLPFLWTLFFFILFSNLIGLFPIATVIELATNGSVKHIGGTPTGNLSNTAALAILVFVVIHASGLLQIFRDLVRGTYGHHAAHEEHSSNGTAGHEAAADIEHMRAEALPADIPQKFTALGNPTQHYSDDEHPSHASMLIPMAAREMPNMVVE